MNNGEIKTYDLYDIWYEPWWQTLWFKIVAGIGLFLLIAICIRLIRRWGNRTKLSNPGQEALAQLQAIDLRAYEEGDTHKIFYHRLTSILKKYLSERYKLELAGKTDHEAIALLQKSDFPADLCEQFRAIVQGAVFIKFANQDALYEHMRFDLKRGIDMVHTTLSKK